LPVGRPRHSALGKGGVTGSLAWEIGREKPWGGPSSGIEIQETSEGVREENLGLKLGPSISGGRKEVPRNSSSSKDRKKKWNEAYSTGREFLGKGGVQS